MHACTIQTHKNAIGDAGPGRGLCPTVKAQAVVSVTLELLKDQVGNSVVVHFNFNKDNLRNSNQLLIIIRKFTSLFVSS
jgi:hypothetical protein